MLRQLKPFDPAKMGKRKGYCEQNVAMGFGVYPSPNPCSSAKEDMEKQRVAGTLHDYSTLPEGVDVPVFIDTTSKYEHVKVYTANGEWWEDGKKSTAPRASSVFGWGEFFDGVRIVEYVEDPQPEPQPAHKPVDQGVVLAVIRGDYGNGTDRIYRLQADGYDPNEVQRAVNDYLSQSSQPKYYTVQVNDTLTKIAAKYNTSVSELVRLNNIADPNKIYIGQRLRVA